jgi:phosphoglycolate phosphatase
VNRLIALDLDGTLEDSRDDMVAAARRVRAQLGLPAREDALLAPWVNGGMDQLYARCFDDFLAGDPARHEQVRRAYEADYLECVAVTTRLYDGIDSALRELAGLGALACVTNKPERISRRLLDALGVGSLFRAVIGGDTCVRAKPDPVMLATAAERCGIAPGTGEERARRVIMIGDSAADIALARAFGATSVWCAWGYAAWEGDHPADFVAQAPHDLTQIVAHI